MKFILKYSDETSKIPLNSELHCIFYRYSKEMGKVVPVSQQDIVMARGQSPQMFKPTLVRGDLLA